MYKELFTLTSFLLVLALAGTNVASGAMVIERQIHVSSDDAEELDPEGVPEGVDSSDLEFPYEDSGRGDKQLVGLRFDDIAVPKGSSVTNAYIVFVCDETGDGTLPVSVRFQGELNPNAVTFTNAVHDIANRPRTTATAVWAPAEWTAVGQVDQTSNIAVVIQEIVNQDGWKSGNALVLIISDDPDNPSEGKRCAESFDGDAAAAPLLHIEFSSNFATAPNPADGALHEDTWATLTWLPGATAASHDVYLGENFADVEAGTSETFQGSQVGAFLVVGLPGYPYPDGLAEGVTYYWRVDEVEADGVTKHKGDVWSFKIPSKSAYDPRPRDGARNVNPNTELAWTAGFGAKLHAVYFGDNFDDVNNAAGALLQADATYTPGSLELDKTYYWRGDEFDGAVTYTGNVWSFKTRPQIAIADPNLIGWWKFDEGYGGTVTDWSGHSNHGTTVGDPEWVDGIMGGALELSGDDYVVIDAVADDITNNDITLSGWVKTNSFDSNWFSCNTASGGNVVSWVINDAAAAIDEGGPTGYSKTIVSDSEWHMLTYTRHGLTGYIHVDGVRENTSPASFNFSPDDLWSIGQQWSSAGPTNFLVGIVDDVRIYDSALSLDEIKEIMRGDPLLAWNPHPKNNSIVDIDEATQPLSWSPGDEASEHDVYFGTDKDAVDKAGPSDTTGIFRGRQPATTHTPAEGVEWGGGPYYWRIDEYNTDGSISTGGIWSFSVADYLIVDDFESYNNIDPPDPESNRIFEAWSDGFADPTTNGALVGNDLPPYAEKTIVHGGAQSMPYAYDNNLKTSEATLTLVYPRDWTAEGVTKLSLWFRGAAANSAERMFIALNGTAVVYHDDPAVTQKTGWTRWVIDLQSFADQGVNLANVDTIAIGLGTKNSPAAGGSGQMYFDDIGLYR